MQPAPPSLDRSRSHIEEVQQAATHTRRVRSTVTSRLRALLARPRAPHAIVALALLMTSGALTLSLTADDYIHLVGVRKDPGIDGLLLRPWDLFAFARGDATAAKGLMDEGVFPWWSDPKTVIAFFRPLSSLTHWVDYSLFPERHGLIHLHSMLWLGAFLCAVARVYRQLHREAWVASLALGLYALDDARSSAVGWVATRNLLVAMTFGLLALSAHHRSRADGDAKSRWLAPLWLAVGLLGGESAVQACAYLLAYALFLDPASVRARFLSLVPYGLVLLAWRIPYTLLGYGAHGSGLYFDPGREPLAFLEALSTRMPVLLLAQFALPASDLWDALPVLAPETMPYVLLWAGVVVALVARLLWPLWQRDPRVRFWAVGALLSFVPVCAGPIDDRLLTGPGIGCAALLALLFAALVERTYPRPTRLVWVAAGGLALFHGVLQPLFLPVRTYAIDSFEGYMKRADASIPKDPSVEGVSVVALNPPIDLFAMYFPFYREAWGIARPKHLRWLATGVTALRVERLDAHTLKLRPQAGFLANSSQWMLRGRARPMQVGETVALSDATFEVTELTPDQRPAEVVVRFHEPLESPKLHFLQWGKQEYVPFAPPAIGQSLTIPAVDMKTALFGE